MVRRVGGESISPYLSQQKRLCEVNQDPLAKLPIRFTQEDDRSIIGLYSQFPRKWTRIARGLWDKFIPKAIKYRALVLLERNASEQSQNTQFVAPQLEIDDDETIIDDFLVEHVPNTPEENPPQSDESDSEISGDDDFSKILDDPPPLPPQSSDDDQYQIEDEIILTTADPTSE